MIKWPNVFQIILILPVYIALFYWVYHDIKEWWCLNYSNCKHCIHKDCFYIGTDINGWSGCPRKR